MVIKLSSLLLTMLSACGLGVLLGGVPGVQKGKVTNYQMRRRYTQAFASPWSCAHDYFRY